MATASRVNGRSPQAGSAMLDPTHAQRFFKVLYPNGLDGRFLEFRLIKDRGKEKAAVEQRYVRSVDKIPWPDVETFNRKGFNIYAGIAPRNQPRGLEEDAMLLPALWADLDSKKFDGSARQAFLAAFSLSKTQALYPSMVVFTGHGIHAYWLLKQPVPITDENRGALRAVLQGLQQAVGSDAVHDLNRIMRVPGFANIKPEYPTPVASRILHLAEHHRFELADFAHLVATTNGPSKGEEPTQEFKSIHGEEIPDGERNNQLFRFGCWLRAIGRDEQALLAILRSENLRRCTPPIEDAEIQRIVAQVCAYPLGTLSIRHSEMWSSERLVALHGRDLRHCLTWGKWLAWDGKRWRPDDTGEARRRAKDAVMSMYSEAAGEPDDRRRQELLKLALHSESSQKVRAVLTLAEVEPEIAVRPEQFDRDPWLLSCDNGTVDLRTGDLRASRREDFITKLAPVTFDPTAVCPEWEKFLDRIMAGNGRLIDYLQRAIGYTLTGTIREHVLHVLYGTGANGKSTLINTLLALLGDYGKRAAPGLLMQKYQESHPTEVADLRGARFVATVEVEEGRRLAEVLTKELTGGDRMKARRMREDFWEFDPTFKFFLAANHKPVIKGTDPAIWRRILLVPFLVTIPTEKQDPVLIDKLKAELPGILNWAVRGCLAWQDGGLKPPPEVLAASAEYRSEMDVLAQFLMEHCIIGTAEEEHFQELYEKYVQWAELAGERVESRRAFGGRLTEKGFPAVKRGGSRLRQGLRVRRFDEVAV